MRGFLLWDWIILACFGAVSGSMLARLEFAPRDHSDVAVVYAPWVGGGDAIKRTAAAGARLVAVGRWPFVIIARPEDPRFVARARDEGALAILDPGGLYGCSAASERQT